ncbi:MAG: hypothetical protein CO093_09120 [Alphaproteobacteria bacterium CG_4_9_14_3_um_filter_47_13]|nr:MAG: hypothetical protein CO093_09120 [Alphaproteobacteria bacterium CG_4_9_14_3_um_filter_47_13]
MIMSKNTPSKSKYNEVGDPDFKVDLVVNEGAKVAVFHNKPFQSDLSWLEFNLDTRSLDFIMDDGDVRNFGTTVPEEFAKDMQNAHVVLMVLMNEKTKDPDSGQYFPLIIHRD